MFVQEIKASIKEIEKAKKLSEPAIFASSDREQDLSNDILTHVDFSDAYLRSTDLSGANLSDTLLSYADLRYADLKDANFSGAYLEKTILRLSAARSDLLSSIKGVFAHFVQITIKDCFSTSS